MSLVDSEVTRHRSQRVVPVNVYRLLLTACCLLLTAYGSLPIAYCLLPFALCYLHSQSRGGGMADATDLKSVDRKVVWVRLPPSAPFQNQIVTGSQSMLTDCPFLCFGLNP